MARSATSKTKPKVNKNAARPRRAATAKSGAGKARGNSRTVATIVPAAAFSNVSLRVGAKNRAAYERAAKFAGLSLSEWIRTACDSTVAGLKAARSLVRAAKKEGVNDTQPAKARATKARTAKPAKKRDAARATNPTAPAPVPAPATVEDVASEQHPDMIAA